MYRIGELSKICNVSQKTLRFYEEKGLIKPAMVNAETNYRFYDDNSIKAVKKILHLKKFGLTLKQIKSIVLNEELNLDEFIDKKFKDFQSSVRSLHLLTNKNKGELNMKNFVNDEDAIGKWTYFGSANSKENIKKNNINKEPYFLKDIYFLENGQGYWLINGWSKGELYVYPYQYPIPETYEYQIQNGKLYVSVLNSDKSLDKIAIYLKQNDKKYSLNDIERKDNINLSFINDPCVLGKWKGVAIIKKTVTFNPAEKYFSSYIYDMEFLKNGKLIVRNTDGRILNQSWTKGYCINKVNVVTEHYTIKNIDNKEYLFVENKNGDYIYNGEFKTYFVFEKSK